MGLVSVLPLVVIALLFWLVLIRPASRQNRERKHMQDSLTLGAEIMLTSGVFGVVRELADDHVLIEISRGVTIKVARGAVGQIVHQEVEQGSTDHAEPDDAVGPEES